MGLIDTIETLAGIKNDIRQAIAGKHADPGTHFADYAGVIREWWAPEINVTADLIDGGAYFILRVTAETNGILSLSQTVADGASVDWGDGSPVETVSEVGDVSFSHTYQPGYYRLKVTRSSGSVALRARVEGYSYYPCLDGVIHTCEYIFVGSKIDIGAYSLRVGYSGLGKIVVDMTRDSIGDYGLSGNPFTQISLVNNDHNVQFGEGVFYGDEMFRNFSVFYGYRRTDIPAYMFTNCTLFEITRVPDTVTKIKDTAFAGCMKLMNIDLPASLTEIETSAFRRCFSLQTVEVLATTPPTLGYDAFGLCYSLRKIRVPAASLAAYQAATNWSQYASIMEGI